MNVMADELTRLRGTAGNLQVETELIYSKFDDTTVKISASLSKLQNKIAEHVSRPIFRTSFETKGRIIFLKHGSSFWF